MKAPITAKSFPAVLAKNTAKLVQEGHPVEEAGRLAEERMNETIARAKEEVRVLSQTPEGRKALREVAQSLKTKGVVLRLVN